MTEIIDLKNISVQFGTQTAVDNVDLQINKGDVFGVIGYSGAGKSTLVRVINLLQRPTAGEVIVNGQDLTKIDQKQLRNARKKIGMIFQHFNLFDSRTVFDNVMFALKNNNKTKTENRQKVTELLNLVGLSDFADRYPKDLSGGQQQRVAIARALANDPDILISDEATSALDPQNTTMILQLLKELNQRTGLTIVLITHQMEAVKQIADKVAVMEDGRIVERGSILDIFMNSKHELTKKFVDSTTKTNAVLEYLRQQKEPDADELFQLSYVGKTADQPIITSLTGRFNVSVNILAGDIEMLQDTPVGKLLVLLNGDELDIKKALAYLSQQGIKFTRIEAK